MNAFLPDAGRSGGPAARQQGRSLRWQVMAAVVLINLGAALAAMVVTIVNARRATEVEITSSLAIAERFVAETLDRIAEREGGAASLAQLPLHVSGLRHVRIRIEDDAGQVVDVGPAAPADDDADDAGEVPAWFAALVRVEPEGRDMPVVESGRVVGHVRVRGEAADEIAEVWHDTFDLAVLMLAVNVVVLGALYLVLGRLLAPLGMLARGLNELGEGRFGHRVPVPRVRELALIAERFNALGGALRRAHEDNERLNARIIRVQDDERRQIAADLHDELGPCLFGLRANLESIHRLSTRTEPDLAGRIGERIGTMAEILNRVQHLNRRLLRKIRPMALGHVPLATVIAGLMADFERHSPGYRFDVTLEGLEPRYADSVELTVYRCLQEAVTNALRHGGAEVIEVRVAPSPDGAALDLSVEDNGVGMAPDAEPGFGLTGIGERLSALGGGWRIVPAAPRGTRVEMTVPLRVGAAEEDRRSVEAT